MLRIVVERSMDLVALRCSGRLVAGKEVVRLREAVMCQVDKGSILLDLAGVEAIDAAGLGLLVFLHTLGHAVGFELQVRNPMPRVRELLKLTRLDSVLEISDETEGQPRCSASVGGGHFRGNYDSDIFGTPFSKTRAHSPDSALHPA